MPGAQIPTSVTRLESMLGYQAVSLTNFDSSALSAIAAGSKVEIAGAFFTFTVDEAIEASTWTSITTGNTAYIALIPAGVAGSQTVTASYTATAPVWSTSKQGWYASAGSSTRVIGSVYKAEATRQLNKYLYFSKQTNPKKLVEFLDKGSPTKGEIFLALAGYIPAIGDSIIVNGVIADSSTVYIMARAVRTGVSEITISTMAKNGAVGRVGLVFTSGSASTHSNITMAWTDWQYY